MMTLFERKAIEWLKSFVHLENIEDDSHYYAQLLLAMLEGLNELSVSDLLEKLDELENKVDELKVILDDHDLDYYDD